MKTFRLLIVCLCLLLCATPTHAAWTLIAHVSAGATSGGGTFTTSNIDTTGANLLIAEIADDEGSTASTLADSKSNTWTALTTRVSGSGSGVRVRLFYSQGGTFGSGHNFTASAGFAGLAVFAFSGSGSSPFDVENGVGGVTTVSTLATGSVTPTANGELVIAALGFNSTGSAMTGFSVDNSLTIAESLSDVGFGHSGVQLAWKEQTTAAAINPVFSWTNATAARVGAIGVFKSSAAPQTTISNAQDDVAVIAAGSAGTTYTFTCTSGTGCIHRLTDTIVPKAGDVFTTSSGVILSGAIVLTSPISASGIWHYNSVTARSSDHAHTGTSTNCDAGIARCQYPEDLIIDNVEKRHVTSTGAVTAGTWFYDYSANVVYIGDDPTGHTVELSVAENAFKSTVGNVTIQNLIIEKFAVITQHGAIEDSGSTGGWNVHHNELRYNHGRGVTVGISWHLHHNNIHHNYQMGIGGGGTSSLVDYNTIAYNRSAVVGIDRGWEAGGTKFALTTGLIVRLNNVHHNDGIGLWTDISNRACEYSGNTIDDNTWAGIMHEISFACIIRDNTIRRNGLTHPNVAIGGKQCFIPDSGIFIAASSNVQIYGNYLEGNADGICALQQDRTSDETTFSEVAGSYQVRGLSVHDNVIASSATGTQATGISADYLPTNVVDETGTYSGTGHPTETLQPAGKGYNNHFQCNRYYVGDGTGGNSFWQFTGYSTFSAWQALGHDTASASTCIATNGTVGTYVAFASYTAFTPPAARPHLRLVH